MKILPLYFLLFLTSLSYSQSSLYVTAGMNRVTMDDINGFIHPSYPFKYDAVLTTHAGLYYRTKLHNRIDFSSNLLYSVKGSNWSGNDTKNTYGTIFISPKLEYRVFKEVRVGFGGYVSHILKQQSSYPIHENPDVGLAGHIAYSFHRFIVAIGIEHGLRAITNAAVSVQDEDFSSFLSAPNGIAPQYNRNLQFTIGYRLIGKN